MLASCRTNCPSASSCQEGTQSSSTSSGAVDFEFDFAVGVVSSIIGAAAGWGVKKSFAAEAAGNMIAILAGCVAIGGAIVYYTSAHPDEAQNESASKKLQLVIGFIISQKIVDWIFKDFMLGVFTFVLSSSVCFFLIHKVSSSSRHLFPK